MNTVGSGSQELPAAARSLWAKDQAVDFFNAHAASPAVLPHQDRDPQAPSITTWVAHSAAAGAKDISDGRAISAACLQTLSRASGV